MSDNEPRCFTGRGYLGIDPGKSGAMAILEERGDVISSIRHDNTTEHDRCGWVKKWADMIEMCVLEKVHAFPGQGVSTTFTFGESYGKSQGMILLAGIPFELKTPRTWQKSLSIKKKKKSESQTDFKRRLKGMAQQLFPDEKIVNANADAYLIAEYCRRKHGDIHS